MPKMGTQTSNIIARDSWHLTRAPQRAQRNHRGDDKQKSSITPRVVKETGYYQFEIISGKLSCESLP